MNALQGETYEYETDFGTYTVEPYLGMYQMGKNLYMGLRWFDEEYQTVEPFCDVTVNLEPLPYLVSAIDTNNNGNCILDFLEQNGFGERTGYGIPSGFCVFPTFTFNQEKLRAIDPEAFDTYAKAHGRDKELLKNQIEGAKAKAVQKTPAKLTVPTKMTDDREKGV